MSEGQTRFIRQHAYSISTAVQAKEQLPLLLSILTNKVIDHAYSKILCWEQQCQIQNQSSHFVRHYDLQCQGVFIIQGIFKKKVQNALLNAFQVIKQGQQGQCLSVNYGNTRNNNSLENSRASKHRSRILEKFQRNSQASRGDQSENYLSKKSVAASKPHFFQQLHQNKNTLNNTSLNSLTEKKLYKNWGHNHTSSNASRVIRQKSKSYKESLKRLIEGAKATNEQSYLNNENNYDLRSMPFKSCEALNNPQRLNLRSENQKQLNGGSTTLNIPYQKKLMDFEQSEYDISNLLVILRRNRQERRKSRLASGYHKRQYSVNFGLQVSPSQYQNNQIKPISHQPYTLNNIWSRDSLSMFPKRGQCVKDMYCCVHGRHY